MTTVNVDQSVANYTVSVDQSSADYNITLSRETGVIGVPTGGNTGQLLAKVDNTDWNTAWITAAGTGDMLKATYDTNANGIVDKSESLNDGASISLTAAVINTHLNSGSNPHSVTAAQVSLGNVINAAQVEKSAYTALGDLLYGAAASSLTALSMGAALTYLRVNAGRTALEYASVSAGDVTSVFSRTGAVVAVANDYTWADIDKSTSTIADINIRSHALLADVGSNSHAAIDSHIASATIHFLVASIDHTAIANIGTNSHAAIDAHIASATIHFLVASIDHTAITNIGTNTHAQIDDHIASTGIHFLEAAIDHTAITNIGSNSHAAIDAHIASTGIHFLEAAIDHTAITNIGSNTHAQIDTHLSSTANPHGVTATQVSLDKLSNDLQSKAYAGINTQTGDYTLVGGDVDKLIQLLSAGSIAVTVPPSTYSVGTSISLLGAGAGEVQVASGAGVSINSSGGGLKLSAQWSIASLFQYDTDAWVFIGDITT